MGLDQEIFSKLLFEMGDGEGLRPAGEHGEHVRPAPDRSREPGCGRSLVPAGRAPLGGICDPDPAARSEVAEIGDSIVPIAPDGPGQTTGATTRDIPIGVELAGPVGFAASGKSDDKKDKGQNGSLMAAMRVDRQHVHAPMSLETNMFMTTRLNRIAPCASPARSEAKGQLLSLDSPRRTILLTVE